MTTHAPTSALPGGNRRTRRLRSSLIALSLGIAVAGCVERSEKELIASAKDYEAKHDNGSAIVQLKAALQQNPQSPEARFLLGRALLDSGDAPAAIVELDKALDLHFDDNQVVPALARALLQVGESRKVVDRFARTKLQDRAAVADLQASVASAYARLGDRARTDDHLADALAAVPDFPAALMLQAALKSADGDLAGAHVLLDRVLKSNPDNARAWEVQGRLQLNGDHDPEAALASLRNAVRLDPKALSPRLAIVGLKMQQRDVDGVQAEVDQLKKVAPNHPETRFTEAKVALLRGELQHAQDVTEDLLRLAPNNVQVLQLAGAIALQQGSLLQAEKHLGKAVQLVPSLPVGRRLLAQALLRSGQVDRALSTLAPLLEARTADAEAMSLAAEALLINGQIREAEAMFDRAASIRPDDSRLRTALALTELAKGNAQSAFSELESIAARDDGTVADLALISARLQRGEVEPALRAIDALERKQPAQPVAPYLRGTVQLGRDQVDAARASFGEALRRQPAYFPAAAALASLDVRERRFDAARQRFDDVLKAEPRQVSAMISLAELAERTGSPPAEVARLLGDAIAANPDEAHPRALLVAHHLREKDPKAALAVAQDAAAALSDNPEIVGALGQAQLAAGQPQQAISSFNRLATLEPRSPQAHLRLAEAHLAIDDRAGATASLDRALEIRPDLIGAQRMLIAFALRDKRFDDGLAIARRVQTQRPKEGIGWLFEGDVEAARGRWDPAIAAYRASLARQASTEVAVKLHTTLVRAGQPALAERTASAWAREHPKDLAFKMHLGDLALAAGDFAGAESQFASVVEAAPTNAMAQNNLAFALLKQHKPDAVAHAKRANELLPDQPALMDTLALALAADGQFGPAIETQRRAVGRDPKSNSLRLNLARIYLQAGDRERGRAELETLRQLGERFADHAEVTRLLKTL
jgi:putative PEP-CTERM system TPR-repeat lipoprotein